MTNTAQDFATISRDGKMYLRFHRGQWRTWQSPARFVLMAAGTQGGKTSFGPFWLYREFLRMGAGDYLAVTTNYDLFKLKMLPALQELFIEQLKIGRWWGGKRLIEIAHPQKGFLAKRADDKMYSRILLRSAVSNSGLESATVKAAWLDEVGQDGWDITVWEAVLRRLSLSEGRVLGTTTIYNSGWLKSEWYDRWGAGDSDYDVIQFDSIENPAFPRREFEKARDRMPAWKFDMFYRGRFATPPGQIYGVIKAEHWVSPIQFDISRAKLYIGVDFGGANTATLYIVEDMRNYPSTYYVVEEHLEGNISTKEHVERAKFRIRSLGFRTAVIYGGAVGESQERRDWRQAGLIVQRPLIGDVESGISNVISLVKTGRLRFFDTLRGLRHEIATYRRETAPDGAILNAIHNKHDYHRLDALRYIASSFQPVGAAVSL